MTIYETHKPSHMPLQIAGFVKNDRLQMMIYEQNHPKALKCCGSRALSRRLKRRRGRRRFFFGRMFLEGRRTVDFQELALALPPLFLACRKPSGATATRRACGHAAFSITFVLLELSWATRSTFIHAVERTVVAHEICDPGRMNLGSRPTCMGGGARDLEMGHKNW